MFKRAHSTKPTNLISSSARKKLIQQARSEFFQNEQTTQEEQNQIITQLIPPIISSTKAYTHLDHQLFIYLDNQNQPIWIKLDKGNGRLVPTVYTLLKYPNLLPILRTNQMVLEKLSHGADLMIPGVIQSDLQSIQHLKKDTLVSIASTDSTHLIWAVGFLAADGTDLVNSQNGKAVITIHTQTDYLWNSGRKEIPNQIEIIPTSIQQEKENTSDQLTEIKQDESIPPTSSSLNDHVQLEKLSIHPAEVDLKSSVVHSENQVPTEDDTHQTEDVGSGPSKLSPTEVDDILKQALLTSLWKQKVEQEIPMAGTKFYSNYILPNRHFECPKCIGVKDSSAKNLAKWLKNMHKLKFITIKEDHKKRIETLIIDVNLNHPEVLPFRKYRTIHDVEMAQLNQNKQDDRNHSSALDADSCLFQLPETKITPIFKAKKNEGGWFWLLKLDLDPEASYTHQEIKEHLLKYINETICGPIERNKLGLDQADGDDNNKTKKKKVNLNLVKPDDYLRSAMGNFPNSDMVLQETFNRNEILESILSNSFVQWWRLERNGHVLVEKKGEVPNITLRMKKKSGSKQSTLITGLEFFAIDPVRFAKELKTLCAGSATTRAISHDPNGYNKVLKEIIQSDTKIMTPNNNCGCLVEVECQGDQRQFLCKYLTLNTPILKQSVLII